MNAFSSFFCSSLVTVFNSVVYVFPAWVCFLFWHLVLHGCVSHPFFEELPLSNYGAASSISYILSCDRLSNVTSGSPICPPLPHSSVQCYCTTLGPCSSLFLRLSGVVLPLSYDYPVICPGFFSSWYVCMITFQFYALLVLGQPPVVRTAHLYEYPAL
jgi:hypothetical protein